MAPALRPADNDYYADRVNDRFLWQGDIVVGAPLLRPEFNATTGKLLVSFPAPEVTAVVITRTTAMRPGADHHPDYPDPGLYLTSAPTLCWLRDIDDVLATVPDGMTRADLGT